MIAPVPVHCFSITFVIANRIGNSLPSIIGIDQTSAVNGRPIFDNHHLLRNVIDHVEQNDIAACFVCLDQETAFNRVSWSNLFDTLQAFGFDDNFINWVKLLYTNRYMCLLYGLCIVLNSVPLSLDLTLNDPWP